MPGNRRRQSGSDIFEIEYISEEFDVFLRIFIRNASNNGTYTGSHGMNGSLFLALIEIGLALEVNMTLKNIRIDRHTSLSPLLQQPVTMFLSRFALKNVHLSRFLTSGFSGNFNHFNAHDCWLTRFKEPLLSSSDSSTCVADQTFTTWTPSPEKSICFERCTFAQFSSAIALTSNTNVSFSFCSFTGFTVKTHLLSMSGSDARLELHMSDFTSNCQNSDDPPILIGTAQISHVSVRGCNSTQSKFAWAWQSKSAVIDSFTLSSQAYISSPISIASEDIRISQTMIKGIEITESWSSPGGDMSDLREITLVSMTGNVVFEKLLIGQNKYNGEGKPYHIDVSQGQVASGLIKECCFALPQEQWITSQDRFTFENNEQNNDCCEEKAKKIRLRIIADIERAIPVPRKYEDFFFD